MIKGHCFTNLDDYQKEDWPKMFVALPREGDWVEAKSRKRLRVCKVTHMELTSVDTGISGPFIKVELTKTV